MNVDVNENVDTMVEFISGICGVKPLNCFPINSYNTESIAFRVGSDSSYNDSLLNAYSWTSSIVIKQWKLKPKNIATASAVNDNRPTASETATSNEIRPTTTASGMKLCLLVVILLLC